MSERHCDDDTILDPAPNRRTVLGGMAGACALVATIGTPALAAGAAPKAAPPFIVDFLAFSSRVTGIPLDRSYIELGQTIWSMLVLGGGEAEWRRRVRIGLAGGDDDLLDRLQRGGGTDALQRLLTVWYTGTIQLSAKYKSHPAVLALFAPGDAPVVGPDNTFPCVVTYNDALVWRACAFTKPPSVCGGEFGYWHKAG